MKTLIVTTALLVGCSGAGGEPFDGSNGANGLDGKNGAPGVDGIDGKDGDPGPAGAQGPAGKDAALSGSRIKATRIKAADGAEAPQAYVWFDSALGIECAFVRLQDGAFHCAPLAIQSQYAKAFSNPQCTTTIFYETQPTCDSAGYALESGGTTCPFEPTYAVRKLGALIPGSTVYALNPVTMACIQFQATGDVFAPGAVVDPSEFVAATIETDP